MEVEIETDERRMLLTGLDRPHGLLIHDGRAIVSEAGTLTSYAIEEDGLYSSRLSSSWRASLWATTRLIPLTLCQTARSCGTAVQHAMSAMKPMSATPPCCGSTPRPGSTAYLRAVFEIPLTACGWKDTDTFSPITGVIGTATILLKN